MQRYNYIISNKELDFISDVRELISIQENYSDISLITNPFVQLRTLYRYDMVENKMLLIEDIEKHLFLE